MFDILADLPPKNAKFFTPLTFTYTCAEVEYNIRLFDFADPLSTISAYKTQNLVYYNYMQNSVLAKIAEKCTYK